jgi:transposase
MRLECPEDLVAEDHPVRMIWSVTERLDLAAFYSEVRALEGEAGRDATDPRLLVALWLYAATEGVGSARELSRLCSEHRAYQWLCGGVSVNYHLLSDFRVGHAGALDNLLTQVIAALVSQKLVQVWRISQDGTRVRACAGGGSFRRRSRLLELQQQAREHVAQLRQRLEDPQQSAGLSARQRSAQQRAAREREARLEQALARLPELEARQQALSEKSSAKQRQDLLEPRVSTTDPHVSIMRMSDGGYRPAVNVQLASDPQSRAIVGVDVSNRGVDVGQSAPMRKQVEQRAGESVREHLLDGGYLNFEEIEQASKEGVELFVPPKPTRNQQKRKDPCEPRLGDSKAVALWRTRMGSAGGKEIYKLRGQTIETINADLKTHRGLDHLTVRGVDKIRCVALWSAMAYNLLHFGRYLSA